MYWWPKTQYCKSSHWKNKPKENSVILGHLTVQDLQAKALSALNYFQRWTPRALVPYFYGGER